MWPLHIMDYDPTFRREGILTPAPAGTNLRTLSSAKEASHSLGTQRSQVRRARKQTGGHQALGSGEWDLCNGTGSVLQEESVPLMDGGGGHTTM